MWSFKDHGKSYDKINERVTQPGFRWVHDSFGSNYRMTEMQAAIGRIQLVKLAAWSERRRSISEKIYRGLVLYSHEKGPIRLPRMRCGRNGPDCNSFMTDSELLSCKSGCQSAYYKLYIYVKPNRISKEWSRDRIIAEINQRGIPCFSGTCGEVYLEKAFDNTGFRPLHSLPVAKELAETAIMFLVHPTLSDYQVDKMINEIQNVLNIAGSGIN